MKRQGLNVTPKQLREIADYLENEFRVTLRKIETFIPNNKIQKQKFMISIINKTPKMSDTWEVEKWK